MEQETVNPEYQKGFEQGYWLQRGGGSQLDELMNQSKGHKQYYSGLKGGQKEAQREKFREQMKDADNNQQKDKEHGIEMD